MARSVIFSTPGLIDIRSFTTFGISAKPNSVNPIGFFGTGLKYAIAVLVRIGAEPEVWIGRDRYRFQKRPNKFRDLEFDFIVMRRQRWSALRHTVHHLPFTTTLGARWERWQAFRELEANTRDENGTTHLATRGVEPNSWFADGVTDTIRPEADRTLIVIENEDFAECYLNRDEVFLPGALAVRTDASGAVQVLEGQAKRVYYRGLRVKDLDKPTEYTYNFLETQDLTEDRTLKYDFMARGSLARYVATSHDAAFVERVLTAGEEYWEHGLEFDSRGVDPSPEFLDVVTRRRGAVSPSAIRYASGYAPASRSYSTWDRYHTPWRRCDWSQRRIEDADGNEVLTVGSDVHDRHVAQLVTDILDIVNRDRGEEVEGEAPPAPVDEAVAEAEPEPIALESPYDGEIPF